MSIITWLCQYYGIVWSLSHPLRSFVLTSDSDISPLPTFSTLPSVILERRSFSSFSCVSTFSRALGLFWLGLPHRMAVIAIYPTNYATLRPGELRHYILRKGCASRNVFIWKEKCWARISREVKTLKALKVTLKCVYGPSLEYGNDWTIFFFHWYVKNN